MAESDGKSLGVSHMWRPIEPAEAEVASYDFHEIDRLQRRWLQVRREVERSAPEAYRYYTERLIRRWP